jgi:F-type H+-transporting ATPase subunit delta
MARSANQTAARITKGLVDYLKKTNQLGVFPELVQEALKKTRTQEDPNLAIVTTAIALTQAQKKELRAILSGSLNREIRIRTKVDAGIIGGIHVKVGDKVIDNTVASKIEELGDQITQ